MVGRWGTGLCLGVGGNSGNHLLGSLEMSSLRGGWTGWMRVGRQQPWLLCVTFPGLQMLPVLQSPTCRAQRTFGDILSVALGSLRSHHVVQRQYFWS